MPTGNLENDTRLIESEWVKEAMMQLQELPREERQERNKNFVKSIAEYRGSKEEGFVWMNEKLHGETCKRILADIDWTGGMKNKAEEKVEDSKNAVRDMLGCAAAPKADGMSFCSVLKRIRMVFLLYFDVVKDILVFSAVANIVYHMNTCGTSSNETLSLCWGECDNNNAQEGWSWCAIGSMMTPKDFPTGLVALMFLSIVIPLTLSAITMMFRDPTFILGGEAWYKYKKNKPSLCRIAIMKIFIFVFYLAMPAILINVREAAKSRLQLWIESKREETKENKITVAHLRRIRLVNDYLEETRVAFLIFKRNELTLENVLQIFLQGVMVLLSPHYTPHSATNSGLQSVFKDSGDTNGNGTSCEWYQTACQVESTISQWMPVDEATGKRESSLRMILIFSVVVSIKTTASTYVKIKTEEKIKFFPLLSKLFLALRALVAYSARAACIVGFFVPFLGLLDVLAHWKAEQSNQPTFKNDTAARDDFCNSEQDGTELTIGRCHYSKYTGVTLQVAFGFFMLGLFVQTGIGLLVKLAMNKQFRKTTFASKLQHIALIVNLPDNYGDWTSGGGDPEELRRRRKMHLVENFIMILLQFISHLLMVIPFYVTGESFLSWWENQTNFRLFTEKNTKERQNLLMGKVQVFDQEFEALERLALIRWLLPLAIVVTSLIDLFMVIAFQKWFHPWRRIIAKPKGL